VDFDDDLGAVKARREVQRGAGVLDGVDHQFVGDEQDRLGVLSGDAPGAELAGEAPAGVGGRGVRGIAVLAVAGYVLILAWIIWLGVVVWRTKESSTASTR
jgi:hypothetical protein